MTRDEAINKLLDEHEAMVREAARYRRLRAHGIVTLFDGQVLAGAGLDEYADSIQEDQNE